MGKGIYALVAIIRTEGQVNRMRLIDADELIKDRVENDPVRIAAGCAPTAFDNEKVMRDATPEEQECIDNYLKDISEPTGVNIVDLIKDGDD